MPDLLLSRSLHPSDYDHFPDELRIVDAHAGALPHTHRRWEYGLTLHAIWRWIQARKRPVVGPVYDVGGGSGSTLHHMLNTWTQCETFVIDPTTESGPLEQCVRANVPLADVVTCVSVIEHVPEWERFAYHLSCLVAPGGLLVLTMDYWNKCGPDTAANHPLRHQIFCPKSYAQLRNAFVPLHLTTFGGVDPTWHGAHVWDYTFASLILEKRA